MPSTTLVIVPCGRSKIWDKQPHQGPTPAAGAYTSGIFRRNCQYAERFSDAWVILSAKYGFMEPAFEIPGWYNVSFKHPSTRPISYQTLRQQAEEAGLDRYPVVVGLGGRVYREAVTAAFASSHGRLVFPFAGLQLGHMMHETIHAIETGFSGVEREMAR